MHRSHDAARIGAAVRTLRGAGIDNISLDLIFALPAELERDWARDLEQALALGPAHLSLYGLTVEDRTPLARWISRGAAAPPDDDRYADEYLLAHSRLAACDYRFYEVSNAVRDGRRSRHNSAYWSGRPYRGLGPAAHSFDGTERRWNLAAWEAYRRAVAAGRSPVASREVLSDEQRELERVYLALRTDAGLDVAALSRPLPSPAARLGVGVAPDPRRAGRAQRGGPDPRTRGAGAGRADEGARRRRRSDPRCRGARAARAAAGRVGAAVAGAHPQERRGTIDLRRGARAVGAGSGGPGRRGIERAARRPHVARNPRHAL